MIKFMDRLERFVPDISLPARLVCLLAFLYVVGLAPAALWAGAITPVVLSQASTQSLVVPVYRNVTWLEHSNPPNLVNDQGVFGYQPEFYLQGLLLTSAASASPRHGETVVHAKLDKTGYSYVGRSYGVGSSVGLHDTFATNATDYKYYEVGLHPQVSCIYNTSTAVWLTAQNVTFISYPSSPYTDPPQFYTCNGTLPNGPVTDCFGASYWGKPVHASALYANQKYYIGFVTDKESNEIYSALYQAQCEVEFSASNYSVDVSVTNQTITVKPLSQEPPPPWPLHGTRLANQTFNTIDGMSRILSSTLWTDVLGNAFISNIANVAGSGKGGNIDGSNASTAQQNLIGIEDSITSLIDNTLVSVNSAQLLIMNDIITTSAHIHTPAIGFGTAPYIYAVLAINFAIILLFMEELIRTRCWRGLSSFRFGDSVHLAVAASGGGSRLYHAASKSLPAFPRSLAVDELSDDVSLRFEHGLWPGIPVLVLDRCEEKMEEKLENEMSDQKALAITP